MLDLLLAQSKVAIAVRQDPARLRKAEIMRAAGIADVARQLLNWRPLVPLEATLGWTLQEFRRQTGVAVNDPSAN
jgi:GDP-4-dehydro-6-deoxy-D-mannose reductase